VAELAKAFDPVIRFVQDELRTAWSGACLPLLRLALDSVRADMQQRLEELNAGDSVDHAVVHLDDQRERVVLDAFDNPKLPQGPTSIEVLREQPPDQTFEGAFVPGKRQPGMAQMEAHVETVIVDPDRVPKGGLRARG